jgi:hypothetical protein
MNCAVFWTQRTIALLLILFADIFIEFSIFILREAFLLSEKKKIFQVGTAQH